ncbi:MAG: alanine--tRNA ligase [Thiomargarita sp.]|nr:alanine--tRNA ligase [Thiomargarita sp.]
MNKTVSQLRQLFLDYFKSKQHTVISTSPLIPANDPTLLFTNAGMVQFKETFLGLETRPYTRAVTCQRCIRAGGKHNDLENVGYTARHHTFFEMLGNFSFGDYFKTEAIEFAWEFLTEVLELPPEKLWITVYKEDKEAANIWLKKLKIDPTRFSYCGEKDNFWSMGNTGPCGPCSEIFYDHGADVAGGPPGSADADGDRYVEIWNLVFMQYNRDSQGQLTPLAKPSIDTGMGLERLAAVMQNVHSNYEIELFQNLIKTIAKIAACQDLKNNSLQVIADHIRSCTFLILDGIIPSNEGRGYVLRRIIRRAIRHGHQLGLRQPFFYRLVKKLNEQMGTAYPELEKNVSLIERILKQEELRFAETLDRGMLLLEQVINELQSSIISGEIVFKLYDTYGFPTDLTADIARERNLSIDMAGFEQNMAKQRSLSSTASNFAVDLTKQTQITQHQTKFTGYECTTDTSTVIALLHEGQTVETLHAGQIGQIILATTPFYGESGGQMGDIGYFNTNQFKVTDTKKMGSAIIHIGVIGQSSINIGDQIEATINPEIRQAIARNHTATHLLHSALRNILGEHVKQKGSSVAAERLRFDFSHFEPVTAEQLQTIEQTVNQQILLNTTVETQIVDLETAMNSGAMALFGEKYDEKVRVLSIGDFSTELCGGTHVSQLGNIGLFKIVMETGVAAGVRRIEAITGNYALNWVKETEQTFQQLSQLLKTNRNSISDRLSKLLIQQRQLEKEVGYLQAKLASSQGSDLASQAVEVKGIKILAVNIENVDVKQLRSTLDQLKNKLATAAIILTTVKNDKISLVAGVTKDATDKIQAGKLLNFVAKQVGGKGGGRADMAQGGGSEPDKLKPALASVVVWVKEQSF